MTLLLFSVAAFWLVHLIAAQGRTREFGVLRVMGVSERQLLILVGIEGVVMLFWGLLAGGIVGLCLAYVMIPFLLQALAESLAGFTIQGITVDWSTIAQLYLFLLAIYGSALVFLLLALAHPRWRQVHWVPWREDE
jgi:ABC-type antimicrobial peptide transport system permease subunit